MNAHLQVSSQTFCGLQVWTLVGQVYCGIEMLLGKLQMGFGFRLYLKHLVDRVLLRCSLPSEVLLEELLGSDQVKALKTAVPQLWLCA